MDEDFEDPLESFEQPAVEGRGALRRLLWLLPLVVLVPLGIVFAPGLVRLRGGEDEARAPRALEPLAPPASDLEAGAAGAELHGWDDLAALPSADPPELPPLEPADSDLPLLSAPDPAPRPGDQDASMLDCIIEPYEVVELGSPVKGVIQAVVIERGDFVHAGQIVAKLVSAVEQAAVEVAQARAKMRGEISSREARLKLGTKRRERADQLFASEALSLDQREEIDTEADLARHELRDARERQKLAALQLQQALAALKRRLILSPLSGVVVARHLSPGEVVDEQAIVTIAQIDPLRVEVILPSTMFGRVRPGMRATIVPEIPGNEYHVASVTIVDRVIDAASGTFGARLELPNPDRRIPSGLHCEVRFVDE